MDVRVVAGVHQAHPPLKEFEQGKSHHHQAQVRVQRGALLKIPAKVEAPLQTVLTGRHVTKVQRRKDEAESRNGAAAERRKGAKVEKRGVAAGRKKGATAERRREA